MHCSGWNIWLPHRNAYLLMDITITFWCKVIFIFFYKCSDLHNLISKYLKVYLRSATIIHKILGMTMFYNITIFYIVIFYLVNVSKYNFHYLQGYFWKFREYARNLLNKAIINMIMILSSLVMIKSLSSLILKIDFTEKMVFF